MQLKKMLREYFRSSSFCGNSAAAGVDASAASHQQDLSDQKKLTGPDLVLLPFKAQDGRPQHESFTSTLGKLRDQVLTSTLEEIFFTFFNDTSYSNKYRYYQLGSSNALQFYNSLVLLASHFPILSPLSS